MIIKLKDRSIQVMYHLIKGDNVRLFDQKHYKENCMFRTHENTVMGINEE